VGPNVATPAAADDSEALGDCLGLVQVGWPRRELPTAKSAAEAEAEVAVAAAWEENTQQRLAESTVATVVPADAPGEVLASAPFEKAPAPMEASAGDGFLAAEAAWNAIAAASQEKQLAALCMVLGLLVAALRRLRSQCQAEKAALPLAGEPCLEESHRAEVKQDDPDPGQEPTELLEMPPPMRRLRYIGASYVVPRERVERCTSETLSFDVPTLPCVWPLRAQLSRPEPAAPWARLQLTVDIIAASGLPPLLTCTRTEAMARPEECGGTGGTGSPMNEAAAMPGLGAWDEARPGEGAEEGEEGEACPWLKICNAGGTVVATIRRRRDGNCLVQLQDRTTWDLAAHLEGVAPGITFSKQGQEICQATSLGCGREEHIQVDTQPDVQSPESCVLLVCTIAVLAFRP